MSPRSSNQFEAMRDQSRHAILEAALTLFAEKGFHGTSIAQISKAAGVSKGLMYNYFEKKEDLLLGIVQKEMAAGDEIMAQMMAQKTPQGKMTYILNLAFDHIQHNSDHHKLLMMLSLQIDSFPFLKEIVLGKYAGSMALFAPILEAQGIADPEGETQLLAALIDGIALQYHVMGDAFPLNDIKQSLFQKYNLNPKR